MKVSVSISDPMYFDNYFALSEDVWGKLKRRPSLSKRLGQAGYRFYLPKVITFIILNLVGIREPPVWFRRRRIPKLVVNNAYSAFSRGYVKGLSEFRSCLDKKRKRLRIYFPNSEFKEDVTKILRY